MAAGFRSALPPVGASAPVSGAPPTAGFKGMLGLWSGGYAAAASGGATGATAAEIVAAMMAEEIEPGVSLLSALRIVLAAVSGRTVGIGTDNEQYLSVDGTKARVAATFDSHGNRQSVTLDGSA